MPAQWFAYAAVFPQAGPEFNQEVQDTAEFSMQLSQQLLQQSVSC